MSRNHIQPDNGSTYPVTHFQFNNSQESWLSRTETPAENIRMPCWFSSIMLLCLFRMSLSGAKITAQLGFLMIHPAWLYCVFNADGYKTTSSKSIIQHLGKSLLFLQHLRGHHHHGNDQAPKITEIITAL